jgi:hypothetical protein
MAQVRGVLGGSGRWATFPWGCSTRRWTTLRRRWSDSCITETNRMLLNLYGVQNRIFVPILQTCIGPSFQ